MQRFPPAAARSGGRDAEFSRAAEGIDATLAEICAIVAGGDPAAIRQPLDGEAIAALQQHVLAARAASAASGVASPAISCTPMVGPNGIGFLECSVGPLAAGAMDTVQFELTAEVVGVLRNVAFGGRSIARFCDGGGNEGQPCEAGQIGDCPGGNCDPGMCDGGDSPGRGCESDADCGMGGICIDCDRCSQPGVCVTGDRTGESCLSDADCDDAPGGRDCSCGVGMSCTQTTVVPVPQGGACEMTSQCASGFVCADGVCCDSACDEPGMACNLPGSTGVCTAIPAPAPALSPFGWALGVAALLGIGALGMWRRAQGG